MGATVIVFRDTGALVAGHGTRASAEGGITYARSEDGLTVLPIPPPGTPATHFSWPIWLYLWCTVIGASTTTIRNKKFQLASVIATGLHLWFAAVAVGGYIPPAGVEAVDAGSNGAVPGADTEILSASATVFDGSSITAVASTMVSTYGRVALGVDALFSLGGGTATLPVLNVTYDEGP